MKNRTCNVCGGSLNKQVVEKYGYSLVECCSCHFVYVSQIPKDDLSIYNESYFSSNSKFGYIDYYANVEDKVLAIQKTKIPYLNSFAKVGRILDVGCAAGFFLEAARRSGWIVDGIEPSEEAVLFGKSTFGLSIQQGCLSEGVYEAEQFDAVTMWHVLEHLSDPSKVLLEIKRILRPNGILLIEVPNWRGIGAIIKGRNWGNLKPPEHINYFTPITLSMLVRKIGFEVDDVTTPVCDEMANDKILLKYPIKALLWAMYRAKLGGYIRIIVRKLSK